MPPVTSVSATPIPNSSGNGSSPFAGPLVERLFRPSGPALPPQDFSGQTILVVFNPNAKQGRFRGEADSLRQSLEAMGFRVEFLITVADPAERSALIRSTAERLFSETATQTALPAPLRAEGAEPLPVPPLPSLGTGAIHIFPVGGDGIIDETVREVAQVITGPLNEVQPESLINEQVRQQISSVVVANVGTAADIANQVGSPPRLHGLRTFIRRLVFLPRPPYFSGISGFIASSQTLPLGIATVDTPETPGRTAFHSVGFGTSGHLFTQAEANRRANPDSFWNQGLLNYFRVLPQSIREYGISGVDVEIEHHGRVDRFRVGDLMGSSNRIVAAVGGIPGRWGEFKLLAVPNGPAGIFVMGESMIRGLATQLGINMVGAINRTWFTQMGFGLTKALARRLGIDIDLNMLKAESVIWSLSRERQITLRPGERARLRFFDPSTGEPAEVPWQLNGDAVPRPTHEAEIYVPPVTLSTRVAPGAVALQLYQEDELRRGLSLSDGSQTPLPIAARLRAPYFAQSPGGAVQVSSAYYPASDLRAVVTSLDLEPSRLPLLVARAHGVQSPADLAALHEQPLSMDQMERWLRSEEGRRQLELDRPLLTDSFRNRLETHGVGLGLGLVTMFAADALITQAGIDPRRDPITHFSAVAVASHGMNQVGNAVAGTLINRARGVPFDWAMVQSQEAEGLLTSRMLYESNPNLWGALRTSALRSLGVEAGASTGAFLWRGALSVAQVPFRMAWGMGPGLAASRITDTILSRYAHLPEDSALRHYASSAAFFAPSLYHLAVGNRGLGIIESSSMRWVGHAFATGFMADLAFTGAQTAYYGAERAVYERWMNHRVAAVRESEGQQSFGGFLLGLVAPEIGAWYETLDVFHGRRNEYYRRVEEEDRHRPMFGSFAFPELQTAQSSCFVRRDA
ncbi:MAG: hypothetical protein U1F57_01495 [bacterium]